MKFALNRIGGTYKMPVLWRLKDKAWRYSELKKSLSHTSDRMLSKALKELEQDGFIIKAIFAEVPPRVEYSLTERGKKSVEMIRLLREYGLSLMAEMKIKE